MLESRKIQRKKKMSLPDYKPYDPEYHPHSLIERMSNGETNVQVAASWGISENTLYVWRREHEELEEAYQTGLTAYEARFIKKVIQPMIDGTLEGRHAFNAASLIAANKLHWNRANSPSIQNNTQINITSQQTQLSQQMSVEDLTQAIQKDIDYLQMTGVIPQLEDQTSIVDAQYLEEDDASESDE